MNSSRKVCNHPLDRLFHPRAVAIVGVSKNSESQGYMYLRQLLEFPFPGPVYPISIEEQEVLGVPCFKTLREVAGPVDHVISCIPHHQALTLVEDCVVKGVRSIHLFTARMAETQMEDRLDLERQIVHRAREAGIRVIGPNCMGLYCPSVGLSFRLAFPGNLGIWHLPLRAEEMLRIWSIRAREGDSVSARSSASEMPQTSMNRISSTTSWRIQRPRSSPCTWRA